MYEQLDDTQQRLHGAETLCGIFLVKTEDIFLALGFMTGALLSIRNNVSQKWVLLLDNWIMLILIDTLLLLLSVLVY